MVHTEIQQTHCNIYFSGLSKYLEMTASSHQDVTGGKDAHDMFLRLHCSGTGGPDQLWPIGDNEILFSSTESGRDPISDLWLLVYIPHRGVLVPF
jgi:hypothetical protein